MEKPKKEFKKPISSKEDDFIEEEDNRKSIILIIIAIIAVLGLIFASIFLFNEKAENNGKEDDNKIDVKIPEEEEEEEESAEKVTSKTVATSEVLKVAYLDGDGNQIGKTQEVLKLSDRVDESAPKVAGYRFREWLEYYDKEENIYYYIPIYRQNVERIPAEEELYLDEEKSNDADTYTVEVTLSENQTESPTYDVKITGEVEELESDEIADNISIAEQYNHIIALRFNAPEGITPENIAKMKIKVYATDESETLEEDQYYYKGEDPLLEGRDLLDSTDEEYANGEYYFYYYQEVDSQTNATVEVYWGNDPEEDSSETPPYKAEYIEVYNIDVSEVELENEVPV